MVNTIEPPCGRLGHHLLHGLLGGVERAVEVDAHAHGATRPRSSRRSSAPARRHRRSRSRSPAGPSAAHGGCHRVDDRLVVADVAHEVHHRAADGRAAARPRRRSSSGFVPQMATVAPWCGQTRRPCPRPMPLLPPVTSATWPVRSNRASVMHPTCSVQVGAQGVRCGAHHHLHQRGEVRAPAQRVPAVDREALAGDPPGSRAEEEPHGRGDVVDGAETADRHLVQVVGDDGLGRREPHGDVGGHQPGTHGVGTDADDCRARPRPAAPASPARPC